MDGITQQFMSLESNVGNCEQVPAPISGQFTADYNGRWISNSDFDYTLGVYLFEIQSLSVTTQEFTALIQLVSQKMKYYSQLGMKLNLAGNLLIWMTLSLGITTDRSNGITVTQYFETTAFPPYVLNREYQQGSFSNKTATCKAPSVATFDQSNSLLVSM